MSAEVTLIDLDLAAPPDKRVQVAGNVYRVPGDPPTGWLLSFRSLTGRFAEDNVDELDVVAQLRDALVDLFCLRQPDAEAQILDAIDSLDVPRLVQAVNTIYAAADEQAVPAPSRPPRAAGTRSSSRTKTRAASSASSSSSAS